MGCHVVASFMASLSSRKHCGHHHANKAHLSSRLGELIVWWVLDSMIQLEQKKHQSRLSQEYPSLCCFGCLLLLVFWPTNILVWSLACFFKEAQKLLCTKNHGAAWCSNMFFKHFQTDHVQTDHPSIANIPAFLVGSWTNPFEKICNRQIGSWNPKDREGQGRDGYSYISGYI